MNNVYVDQESMLEAVMEIAKNHCIKSAFGNLRL